jgi:hypothetical protein
LTAVAAAVVVLSPPPFVKPPPPLSSSCLSPVAMEGVSPPRSAPPLVLANNEDNGNIAVAFGAVVDAPDSRTQGPTAVNNKDKGRERCINQQEQHNLFVQCANLGCCQNWIVSNIFYHCSLCSTSLYVRLDREFDLLSHNP